jgi:predicted kinase
MHGVPGSGKSTVARGLGAEAGAFVLDKDLIATGAIRAGVAFAEAGKVAYEAIWLLLPSALAQGFSLILDSPCFWPAIEENGRAMAARAGAQYLMIECVCEDSAELDRRLASRPRLESNPTRRGAGAGRPGTYTPSCERLLLDTTLPVDDLVAEAVAYLGMAVPA